MASGSSWSRFPPVTLSAVTRGRCYCRDGQQDAAYSAAYGNVAAQRSPGMRQIRASSVPAGQAWSCRLVKPIVMKRAGSAVV